MTKEGNQTEDFNSNLYMKTIINTPNAPAPIGPYNQAVLVDNTLYASGQIALNPKTMELVTDNIQNETQQ